MYRRGVSFLETVLVFWLRPCPLCKSVCFSFKICIHDLQGMVCNTDITECIVGLPVLLKLEMILLISCQF